MRGVHQEFNITCIWDPGGHQWSMWLTEVDKDGDWEIKGYHVGKVPRLLDEFMYLRNQLIIQTEPIPSTKRFKRRRSR
jgi:hypothetical protein